MSEDIKTLELAKIYESQGYFKDAFKIYSFLSSQEGSGEAKSDKVLLDIKEGLLRTKEKLETQESDSNSKDNISRLFENWLMLMLLEKRLAVFKKIKSRFL